MQNQKFEAQLQAVKERLDQARGMSGESIAPFFLSSMNLAQKAAAASPLSFGRIAKPLRGGGGSQQPSVGATSNITPGGSNANPLSRIQNEEGV
jgi:kinesin family member 5